MIYNRAIGLLTDGYLIKQICVMHTGFPLSSLHIARHGCANRNMLFLRSLIPQQPEIVNKVFRCYDRRKNSRQIKEFIKNRFLFTFICYLSNGKKYLCIFHLG